MLLTLVPDVLYERWVPFGLFLVTSVAPAVRFEVVQVTDEVQMEPPPGMVQEVAERVPVGHAGVLQACEELPPSIALHSVPPY